MTPQFMTQLERQINFVRKYYGEAILKDFRLIIETAEKATMTPHPENPQSCGEDMPDKLYVRFDDGELIGFNYVKKSENDILYTRSAEAQEPQCIPMPISGVRPQGVNIAASYNAQPHGDIPSYGSRGGDATYPSPELHGAAIAEAVNYFKVWRKELTDPAVYHLDKIIQHLEAPRPTAPLRVEETYTDSMDVFRYVREKQEQGHLTHPAIVKLVEMATTTRQQDGRVEGLVKVINDIQDWIGSEVFDDDERDLHDTTQEERAENISDTIRQALTRQPVENKPVEVGVEEFYRETMKYRGDTRLLADYLRTTYPHGIIITRKD